MFNVKDYSYKETDVDTLYKRLVLLSGKDCPHALQLHQVAISLRSSILDVS